MAANTVKVKKYSDVVEEYPAGGTITPGMLLQLGSAGTVTAHATSGGKAVPIMFALEDELQGKGIDDNYATGDVVQVWIPGRGDIVNAILTTSQNIAVGDLLVSSGSGRLREYVSESGVVFEDGTIIGQAVEAVTTTTATARIKVRII